MKQRVELNCNTNMSLSGGVSNAKQYVDRAKALGMSAIAFTDRMEVGVFPDAADAVRGSDFKAIYGIKIPMVTDYYDNMFELIDDAVLFADNVTVLAENQDGIKRIYKILTDMELLDRCNASYVAKSILEKDRKNILIGSDITTFKDFIKNNVDKSIIIETAKFFDFIEVACEEEKETVEKIIEIADEVNVPVVAVGNVTFADECDEILYDMIDAFPREYSFYPLLSTEEMLKHFDYLPHDVAVKIVVDNTNAIADKISNNLEPICRDFTYPESENHFEEIKEKAYAACAKYFGNEIPEKIQSQVETELSYIALSKNITQFYAAMKLCEYAKEKRQPITARGAVGNSLVAYLVGISDFNPLQYGLPFETFFGSGSEKAIDINFNVPSDYQGRIQYALDDIVGTEKSFYANTVSTMSYETAEKRLNSYIDITGNRIPENEKISLIERLVSTGIKLISELFTEWKILIPKGYSVYDFTPIVEINGKLRTHFDYHKFFNIGFLKMDILKNSSLNLLRELSKKTGVNIADIPLDDENVMALFTNADTDDIPEFGTDFVKNILRICKPKSFEDLIKINGLCHGTNTWNDNAENLIPNGVCELSEVIGSREDIFNDLLKHGADRDTAFSVMENARKGRASCKKDVADFVREKAEEYGLPAWWAESVCKIKYLFPKAHTVANAQLAVRLAYFKVYYPEAFKEQNDIYKVD